MVSITLTMDPDLARRASALAEQRDISVSALVAQLLHSAIGRDTVDADLWDREQAAMAAGLMRVGDIAWTREELHVR